MPNSKTAVVRISVRIPTHQIDLLMSDVSKVVNDLGGSGNFSIDPIKFNIKTKGR